jgi:hypothetical protein
MDHAFFPTVSVTASCGTVALMVLGQFSDNCGPSLIRKLTKGKDHKSYVSAASLCHSTWFTSEGRLYMHAHLLDYMDKTQTLNITSMIRKIVNVKYKNYKLKIEVSAKM